MLIKLEFPSIDFGGSTYFEVKSTFLATPNPYFVKLIAPVSVSSSAGYSCQAHILYTQRGLSKLESKDGCAYVAKELQRYLENADALSPRSIDPDLQIVVKVEIVEFFPSTDRQVLFDMCAGVASRDYPHTAIKKGDCIPTYPTFQALLPIITRFKRVIMGRRA